MTAGVLETAPGRTADPAEVRRVACADGLVAGLRLVLAGRDVDRLAAATDAGGAVPDPTAPFGIAFGGARRAAAETPDHPPELADVLRLLVQVRLGVTARVLAQAVQHLTGRRSGDVAIIDLPAVRMTVADVHSGADLVAAAATGAVGTAVAADLHERVTALDGELLTLFGASGALRGSPGHDLLLSERVADHWAPPTGGVR